MRTGSSNLKKRTVKIVFLRNNLLFRLYFFVKIYEFSYIKARKMSLNKEA